MTRSFTRLTALLLQGTVLFPLATGAVAQQTLSLFTPAAPAAEAAVAKDGAVVGDAQGPTPDAVELAALYYYAKEGRMDRVTAETRRLQLKYPGFSMPGDVFAPEAAAPVDESSLWALYEADDYSGIETEVTRIAAANLGWEPSEDFRTKLERRKQRHLMSEAYKNQDWPSVIAAGQTLDPQRETEVDLLWMLIEAYRESHMAEALVPLYRGILFREGEARMSDDVIMTTLQKAVEDFPVAELRKAVAQFAVSPSMTERMRDLSLDLLRREVADFNSAAAGGPAVAPGMIEKLRVVAGEGKRPEDLTLLGWYALKTEKPEEAEKWFRLALEQKASVETIKGLSLSLLRQKQDDQAYQVVVDHLAELGEESEFLADTLSLRFQKPELGEIDAAVVTAYSAAIQKSLSADHAAVLGWYAYNSRQFAASAAWFGKSFEWQKHPDSLKGLVLSAAQMKDTATLDALKSEYAAAYPAAFEDLKAMTAPKGKRGKDVAAPAANIDATYVANFRNKKFGACITDLRALEARSTLSADALLIKGWCHLELNHLSEARASFSAVLSAGGQKGQDAAYGLGLTLLRAKLTDDAEAVLSRYPLTAARDREIRSEIYWLRARDAFDRKQYQQVLEALNARLLIAPEAAGISQMRAWSHYHLGNLSQSKAIFAQLNAAISDPANLRGIAVINDRLSGQ
ncbi:hypothetical protein HGO38_07565 [Rhizobium sp. CG5]|uniref:hypothetical protein n=1 Tax=Rhizobium sp. CG5 TaxID=2726076 RepID=UPI0020335575|nr:hypothetical protein [Rhizobium sp. CG5]MCM2473334.1 hypothetical protein [Rhizobium sp. CG5]